LLTTKGNDHLLIEKQRDQIEHFLWNSKLVYPLFFVICILISSFLKKLEAIGMALIVAIVTGEEATPYQNVNLGRWRISSRPFDLQLLTRSCRHCVIIGINSF
jgi:hypothetical protein